ncbi:hypothetical protein LX99_04846 [Mucilaginibacter oryzae]|uniref:Uncharacterized protein n=1 Tax=Mucilaginibacter oryzae TaxID=468058 RepID=A0A316GW53_9SPHI|nr:hypothetical protein [Mucilaginibacter oryzae]PWK68321.1 hypothetical protein LX99_04846 [Mucilaginibacter oryzae]
MFADYQKQVLLTYHEKKRANQLSPNLVHTTPGRLREECMAVFTARYDHRHDEKILRQFFGYREDAAAYMRAITNHKAAKFKTLDNFLKGDTSGTQEKNIELLAWLIDFRPRPYAWDRSYAELERMHQSEAGKMNLPERTSKEEKTGEEREISAILTTPGVPAGTTNQLPGRAAEAALNQALRTDPVKMSRNPRLRNAVILLLLLCTSGGGLFWVWNAKKSKEQCMCWAGDHYRSISCREKLTGSDVFGMDSLQMTYFKKITRPDTLTQRALGHVWYSKIDGDVEFYTSGGFHPIHRERRLKPLTIYILNKYAYQAAAKN